MVHNNNNNNDQAHLLIRMLHQDEDWFLKENCLLTTHNQYDMRFCLNKFLKSNHWYAVNNHNRHICSRIKLMINL